MREKEGKWTISWERKRAKRAREVLGKFWGKAGGRKSSVSSLYAKNMSLLKT